MKITEFLKNPDLSNPPDISEAEKRGRNGIFILLGGTALALGTEMTTSIEAVAVVQVGVLAAGGVELARAFRSEQ